MNTFLPYADFRLSLNALDDVRLNNQVNEALVLCRVEYERQLLSRADMPWNHIPWVHHPAAKMYQCHLPFLRAYFNTAVEVCIERGISRKDGLFILPADIPAPWWFGVPEFHRSHQSNLLQKDFRYYDRWSKLPMNLQYLWPLKRPFFRLGNTTLWYNSETHERVRQTL